jgi:hypothetical protein
MRNVEYEHSTEHIAIGAVRMHPRHSVLIAPSAHNKLAQAQHIHELIVTASDYQPDLALSADLSSDVMPCVHLCELVVLSFCAVFSDVTSNSE